MKQTTVRLTTAALFLQIAMSAQTAVERKPGFIPMVWDADQGKLFFELSDFDKDILY